jgi:DNA adenine methylase
MVKSLLRYPGGKTRACKYLEKYIPDDTKELCSPFFGGGSFEFHLINKGVKIYGADIYSPLISFWQEAMQNPVEMAEQVQNEYPCSLDRFKELQKTLTPAEFYVVNRCSFSGLTASGGMSVGHPRFNQYAIDRLKNWKCPEGMLDITCESFETFMIKHKNKMMYLDPPYVIKNYLYGNKGDTHKDFDHDKLRNILKNVSYWLLSYNDCEQVREAYSDFTILPIDWAYAMGNSKKSNEVVILSKKLKEKIWQTIG